MEDKKPNGSLGRIGEKPKPTSLLGNAMLTPKYEKTELPPDANDKSEYAIAYAKGQEDAENGIPKANLEGKSVHYKAGYEAGWAKGKGKT
jgi:hypothetical protein